MFLSINNNINKILLSIFFNNSNYNELNINKIKEDLLEIYTSEQ